MRPARGGPGTRGARGAPARSRRLTPRAVHPVQDRPLHAFDGDPLLSHGVPIANRDGEVLERIDVHGHAPRRPDLILAAIELPDRGRVVGPRPHVPLWIG